MGRRVGGSRRKTRSTFSKERREKGKLSLRKYFQVFASGARVALKAEPSVMKGLYFRRFHGKVGVVTKKLGSCYEVLIEDQGKRKQLIVHAVHLKQV